MNHTQFHNTHVNTFDSCRFIYGKGVTCVDFEVVDPLFVMAEKYNVKGLVNICRELLIQSIEPKHYVRAAILGYLTNNAKLKNAAMKAMVETGDSIKKIEDWEELKKYPELSFEMLDYSMTSEPLPHKRRRCDQCD